MRIVAETLDDLCRRVLTGLLRDGEAIHPTRAPASEHFGVLLELRRPRARLSRTETRGKPFSCLGELLWYLSRDNQLDFICYYVRAYEDESEDGETVHGGYGPRLFRHRAGNQVQSAIEALKRGPSTRRAVIQIFDAEDVASRHKEVPCTCTLQFLVRRQRLHMLVSMRSNDAYKGLPHDVFCFTMLQEIVARSIGIEIGVYKQFVGSLHLYDADRALAQQYLDEGVRATVAMPPMPLGDPWPALSELQAAEAQVRHQLAPPRSAFRLDPYWCDLIRLLQIFAATGDARKIQRLKAAMAFKGYHAYVEGRKSMKRRPVQPPRQLRLALETS
jgi:thymidylate synthase